MSSRDGCKVAATLAAGAAASSCFDDDVLAAADLGLLEAGGTDMKAPSYFES
jgi:hypothetical protein